MPNTSNCYIFMCSRASCSTQMFHNSCVPDILAQHKYKYSCAPKLLTQYKHQIPMCSRAPRSTQKHLSNYALQGPCPTHEIIDKKHMQLAYVQYIKQIIMFMCSGVLGQIYQLKHKSNIIRNGHYTHKC